MPELLRYLNERNIEIGSRIPDFLLVDQADKTLRLRDLSGSPAVLFFYPKDGSEGCTVEACEFRDVYDDFKQLDCPVYGISPDTLESHNSFAKEHELPFNLCVDPDKQMINEYGVMGEYLLTEAEADYLRTTYGAPINEENKLVTIVRSTFLMDKDGILVHKWMNVNFRGHASSVRDQLHKSFKFDIAF